VKRMLVVVLLAGAALYGALSYHVVLTRDGLVFERKDELTFEDTFADARHWGPIDWIKHPRVAKALLRHGGSGLSKVAGDAIQKAGEELEKIGKQIKK
jgi:hypothetical protein